MFSIIACPNRNCRGLAPGQQSAGDAKLVVVNFLEGADREELMAAGYAAVSRHAEDPLDRGGKARDVFGGYAFELVIAADGAVSGKEVRKWRKSTAKTQPAMGAAPRQAADQSGGEIPEGASA